MYRHSFGGQLGCCSRCRGRVEAWRARENQQEGGHGNWNQAQAPGQQGSDRASLRRLRGQGQQAARSGPFMKDQCFAQGKCVQLGWHGLAAAQLRQPPPSPCSGQACFAAGSARLCLLRASGRRKHLPLACTRGGAVAEARELSVGSRCLCASPQTRGKHPSPASRLLHASPPLPTPHTARPPPARHSCQPPPPPRPLTVGAGGQESLVPQPLGGAVGVELVLAGQAKDLRGAAKGGKRAQPEA